MSGKFAVHVPKSVEKIIKKIPVPWRNRVSHALRVLEDNPFVGGKMLGELQAYRKIRIWPYRIVYRVDEKQKIIFVTEVGHRGNVSYNIDYPLYFSPEFL